MKKYLITFGVEKDQHGNKVEKDYTKEIKIIIKGLSKTYGGATLRAGRGAWIDSKGALVLEKSFTVEVIDFPGEGIGAARVWAEYIKEFLQQEAVILESVDVDAKII